jgi:hypothetical protein
MRTSVKVVLVAFGYVGAFLVAAGVVALHAAWTNGPDRQAYSGMYAFGDSFLFLGVFGVAAVPPTGTALFYLRPYRPFWRVISTLAAVIALTGVAATIVYLTSHTADPRSKLQVWSGFAVLRILVAPLLTLAFLLAAVFAPARPFRTALFGATVAEAVAFACVALKWAYSIQGH